MTDAPRWQEPLQDFAARLRAKIHNLNMEKDALRKSRELAERQVRDLARENERLRAENAMLRSGVGDGR